MLYLKGGTVLIGEVSHFQPGDTVFMKTYTGLAVAVPYPLVDRLKQKCRHKKRHAVNRQREYTFRERGWYHATRAAVLSAANDWDVALQHSSGYKFNRWINVGIGAGVENLSYLQAPTVPSYPLFAEVRGYLYPRRVTPFYAISGGWAFSGADKDGSTRNNSWWWGSPMTRNDWRGGWMAQIQAGYRCGSHLMVYAGLRFQQKRLLWETINLAGTDRFLHKRLEVGMGILL